MRTFASVVKHALVLGTALAVAAGAAAAQAREASDTIPRIRQASPPTQDKARRMPASTDVEETPRE